MDLPDADVCLVARNATEQTRVHASQPAIGQATFTFSLSDTLIGRIHWVQPLGPLFVATPFLPGNLVISDTALVKPGDSWSVGVIEEEQTVLITAGIYGYSRNPYFLFYLLMFVAYSVLLQNGIFNFLAIIGFSIMHWMLKEEESYLQAVHGKEFEEYLKTVGRYLFIGATSILTLRYD